MTAGRIPLLLKCAAACVFVTAPFVLVVAIRLLIWRMNPAHVALALGTAVLLSLATVVWNLVSNPDEVPARRVPRRPAERPQDAATDAAAQAAQTFVFRAAGEQRGIAPHAPFPVRRGA